jgi:hypothetical protein
MFVVDHLHTNAAEIAVTVRLTWRGQWGAPLSPHGMRVSGGNQPMSRKSFYVFQAETIDAMRRAFEEVCGTLQLRKGEPSSALAAEKIFQLAKDGERGPALLAARVIAKFPRQ